MTLDEIYLEARNPARNVMRGYRITLSRDLFGVYLVEARFGRIGTYGNTLTRSFDTEALARGFMDQCLARRRGSLRRNGAVYADAVNAYRDDIAVPH
jgi:predicted DNA-binding WGR domain protein